ncbi:hypothetical protein EJB05_32949, partial [Eragrostis curvula]
MDSSSAKKRKHADGGPVPAVAQDQAMGGDSRPIRLRRGIIVIREERGSEMHDVKAASPEETEITDHLQQASDVIHCKAEWPENEEERAAKRRLMGLGRGVVIKEEDANAGVRYFKADSPDEEQVPPMDMYAHFLPMDQHRKMEESLQHDTQQEEEEVPPMDMYAHLLPMDQHRKMEEKEEETQDSLQHDAQQEDEEVTHTVTFPYSWLLHSIMEDIGCEILRSGVDNYGPGMYCAFIEAELPKKTSLGTKEPRLISGHIKDTHYEAIQHCAKEFIKELCENRNVRVKDVNFSALKKTKKRLLAAEFWAEVFQEKTTEVLKVYAENNTKYAELHGDLSNICGNFQDLLPLETTFVTKGAGKGNKLLFVYNGPPGYPRRIDKLALAILQALQGPKKEEMPPPGGSLCE